MPSATNRAAARLIAYSTGALAGLLAARLLARLLAGRPEQPVLQALYALSNPLIAPLARLDAGQPRFGAVLEFSTLALLALVVLVGYGGWRVAQAWARSGGADATKS